MSSEQSNTATSKSIKKEMSTSSKTASSTPIQKTEKKDGKKTQVLNISVSKVPSSPTTTHSSPYSKTASTPMTWTATKNGITNRKSQYSKHPSPIVKAPLIYAPITPSTPLTKTANSNGNTNQKTQANTRILPSVQITPCTFSHTKAA